MGAVFGIKTTLTCAPPSLKPPVLSTRTLTYEPHPNLPQPASEVFDMIEDLMLMEGGKLTYFGTTKNARCFFDSLAGQCPSGVNPAGTGAGRSQ